MEILYIYGIICLISIIFFIFAIKNGEYHPDKEGDEDLKFINEIEEYDKKKEDKNIFN